MPRNQSEIPLRLLETNLDHEFSKSKESVYSVQSMLESLDERGRKCHFKVSQWDIVHQ